MRRLENEDEGKFWEAWIKDELVFCYRYGKIGSAGHLKLKKLKTRAEAEAELEEKLAEKLAEGFEEPGAEPEDTEEEEEVAAGGHAEAEGADDGAEGADADDDDDEPERDAPVAQQPSAGTTLRSRVRPRPMSPDRVEAAVAALRALGEAAGGRSWKLGRLAKRARDALERLGGADIASLAPVSDALDAVTARVIAPKARLPLDDALSLLWVVDPPTFARTVQRWRARMLDSPAAPAIGVLAATFEGLGETEVAVHVATALVDRRLSRDAFRRWFGRLRPFLTEALEAKGSSIERFAKALRPGGDALLKSRVDEVHA